MKKSLWEKLSDEDKKKAFDFSEGYKAFLNASKTEREAAREIIKVCEERDVKEFPGKEGRFYWVNREKVVALGYARENFDVKKLKVIVSHIDAPRLDLKQNPFYEDEEILFLKTHYYGGIKKYHWVTMPLALHGVFVKKGGEKVFLTIGEDEDDPVFTVTDLLPHLSRKAQDEKKLKDAILGEKLSIIAGTEWIKKKDKEDKEKVKERILELFKEKYGIAEEEFVTGDVEVVPAFKARDVGIDRSMVGGYGQDDRSCAYCSLMAFLDMDIKKIKHPILVFFVDKEEIGSDGNTGAKARFFEIVVREMLRSMGYKGEMGDVLDILFNARGISGDVNGAYDPLYPDVWDKQNSAKLGYGVSISKYTGHGGKYGSSEASAEYASYIRDILDKNGITWQMAGLGKVDEGGGGTVAKFLASYGMDIIDMGVPIISMHSPFEIASKLDIYETYRAYKVFLEEE